MSKPQKEQIRELVKNDTFKWFLERIAIYIAGWQIHKLETVASDVKELKRFKELTANEINNIKLNCTKNHK